MSTVSASRKGWWVDVAFVSASPTPRKAFFAEIESRFL
jgi:hypothetical protein